MAVPPNRIEDSPQQAFPLQFSFQTLFLVFTVAAVTLPLMEYGIPHLIALLTAPVSTWLYLAKRKTQPPDLVFVVSAFFTGLTWGIVAFYAALYSILVDHDYLLSAIGNPFVGALMITLVGGLYGSFVGVVGLMVHEAVLASQSHQEKTRQ